MKSKISFFCTECGHETAKWQGRCPSCGQWNTITEYDNHGSKARGHNALSNRTPKRLRQIESDDEVRFCTGLSELDRVLGGGAVSGSLVLIGGAPGIGKSTLLLQICAYICGQRKVLYISGEESERQLKLRAQRLSADIPEVYVLAETNMGHIVECTKTLLPEVLIVDSIQTLYTEDASSTPGSITQVKACTMELMQLAKSRDVTVFVVGHVNKEGAIAGPKVLEHMVDCVLYFEGERNTSYRLLRAVKNRFGSTNEIGVFEMRTEGLVEVPNPSEMLLAGRPIGTPGTCVACVMEGSRPILAEVQALVVASSYNVPRRTTDGFDYNRAALLLAVMEKCGGLRLSNADAYINVIGGMTLDEPAADLPIIIAVASCYREMPVDNGLVAVGEVGLTGEIRSVTNMEQRLSEIARLGFTQCIIPRHGTEQLQAPGGVSLLRVRNIREAIEIAIG